MGEDWRVSLALHHWPGRDWKRVASWLTRSLRGRLGEGIRVTSAITRIFIWCATADAALEAERITRDVLAELGVGADCWLQRWDPVGREWHDAPFFGPADVPAAWARRQEEDRSRSAASGYAEWNVHVELGSHRDLAALGERLRSGGWPVILRRTYLLAGANCEDDLGRLVPQIQAATSAEAIIRVHIRIPPPLAF